MACGRWNDEWVARLYDELDSAAARDCDEHLACCGECRDRMSRLAEARSILREHAPPVPSAPRVFVLPTRRVWLLGWGFAAGVACVVAGLGLGLVLRPGGEAGGDAPDAALDATRVSPLVAVRQELEELRRLQAAIDRRVGALAVPAAGRESAAEDSLTREEFQRELRRLKQRLDHERQGDLELLLRSLTAAELRTGSWMDETREALQVLALRQDPRFSER